MLLAPTGRSILGANLLSAAAAVAANPPVGLHSHCSPWEAAFDLSLLSLWAGFK